jgi:uncharacterized protein
MNQKNTSLDMFPLTIAQGHAFCNREEETGRLQTCIEHQRPVLLVSPRRYGKTSLALHTIHKTKLPYAHIDLFAAVDEHDIEKAILQGIGRLISRMESIPKKALALAKDIFEGSEINIVMGKVELSMEINRRKEKAAYHVLDILERLESLAKKNDKKLVLFFDEFQCIGEITPDHAMEGVLRQVAQLTKSISFVFSGSNRNLLDQLFEDRKRPFYKLCERITLERISEKHYAKQIQKAAQHTWSATLPDRTLELVFSYTGRHPYYVNLLCSRIFREKTLPTLETIDNVWNQYVMEERSSVASETDLLSKNQRKLLTALARVGETNEPLGQSFIQETKMPKATVE